MWYMYLAAAAAVVGLIWLAMKSRQMTDAKAALDKQRATARAQFLKGGGQGLAAVEARAPSKRPKFGQR